MWPLKEKKPMETIVVAPCPKTDCLRYEEFRIMKQAEDIIALGESYIFATPRCVLCQHFIGGDLYLTKEKGGEEDG